MATGVTRARVGALAHEVDVDVAVAEVAEVDDEGVVLLPYPLDALDQLGHARARDDHVLVELQRPELLDGRRERAPHVPQTVFVLARLRAQDVVTAEAPHHVFDQTNLALDLGGGAVHGDEQQRAGFGVDAEGELRLDGADGVAV